MFWCNYNWLAKLPKIGDAQSMDCDRKIVLMTKHPSFKKKFRCSNKLLGKMKSSNLHNECRGMHVTCDPKSGPASSTPSYNIIYIDHMIDGDKKLLSTIVHEVSHLVDYMNENAGVRKIDTEVNAYAIQYYVEHIFSMMKFSFNTSAKKKKKKKNERKDENWNKKLEAVKKALVKKFTLKHANEIFTKLSNVQIIEAGEITVSMLFKTIKTKG